MNMNKEVKVKDLVHSYDKDFVPSQEYLDSMPDLQNADFIGIPIDFVGIQGMHLPLKVREQNGDIQEVMAEVTGTVSLDASNRGINMSRILRTLYKSKDDVFDINKIEEVLRNYQKDLKTFDAHILMNFKYRMWQESLRSLDDNGQKNGGWQYYNVTFDCNLDVTGEFKKVMWVDFIYSSACPCSTELSNHAALNRSVYGIPHSQRSVARTGLDLNELVWIEDVIENCRIALTTETLVFCKREDEQAFAELNGAQPKFVEDAIRFLADRFNDMYGVDDFKIICSHQESLHNHNAAAVITKGKKGSIFNHHVTLGEWQSLMV
jgi:GTP cyclohydrolase I